MTINLDEIERQSLAPIWEGHTTAELIEEIDRRNATTLDLVARIREQEAQLAEAYQVVGALANLAGVFDHPDVIRALDMLSGMPIDGELSPFPREPWPADPMRADRDGQMERARIAETQLAEADALVRRHFWHIDELPQYAEPNIDTPMIDAAIARHRARQEGEQP